MPRDGKKVRRHLQEAALELYREHGYDQTTAAEIAARAGVTERTFFRHFFDKREVLFDGEGELSTILVEAVRDAPSESGPWDALFGAFKASAPLLIENRALSTARRQVIATSLPLQERELAKSVSLAQTLASALCDRGLPIASASLAAQLGMAAFGQAFGAWLDDDRADLEGLLEQTAAAARDLVSPKTRT